MEKLIKEAYIAGYEQGHNDTVESGYGCSPDKADEYYLDISNQVQAGVKPDACGKWQYTKPEKPCYFIHRYTRKENKPDLYDAYIDGGILSVANIQDDEFICTMEEFADGDFYIVEYH